MNEEIIKDDSPIVKRIEIDGSRFYELDGIVYPSVTSILDIIQPKHLTNYFKNNSKAKIEKTLNKTADFGSFGHHYIEMDLKGIKIEIDNEEMRTWAKNWHTIKEKHQIKVFKSETIVVSKKYGFAGQYDHWGLCDKKPCIIDIKTGFFSNKVGLQMAAYRQGVIENEDISKEDALALGLVGIQIHRDGREPKVFKYEHLEWCFTKFLHTFECWKHEHFQMLNKMDWPFLKRDSVEEYYKEKALNGSSILDEKNSFNPKQMIQYSGEFFDLIKKAKETK